MVIMVPRENWKWIHLLLFKRYDRHESYIVQRLLEKGLIHVLQAIDQQGLEEDLDLSWYQDTDTVAVDVSDDFRGYTKIRPLSGLLKTSDELLLMVLSDIGLRRDGYYFLRRLPKYYHDPEYQSLVDQMPHDPGFESDEKLLRHSFRMTQDEELRVHVIDRDAKTLDEPE